MEKSNYLIRENNTQKVYLTEDTLDIPLIVNENYPYIINSIKKEVNEIIHLLMRLLLFCLQYWHHCMRM